MSFPDYATEDVAPSGLRSRPRGPGAKSLHSSTIPDHMEGRRAVPNTPSRIPKSKSLPMEETRVAFTVNGQRREVGVDGNTPLLWVLREHLKMTGTKFGCGIAACGACTVHIDGQAMRSCAMPVSMVEGKAGHHHRGPVARRQPSAAEGLDRRAGAAMRLLPVRPDHAGGGAAGRATRRRRASEIVEHMDGNICRCGTYLKIISAIQRAAREG